jgi:glycosyltransferase involved in cell wall biosynthesis
MSEAKKDVLFAIGSLATGGAEVQLVMLAEGLIARGWSVRVFSLDGSGPLRGRLDAARIPVIDGKYCPRPGQKLATAISLAKASFQLVTQIIRRKPTILHGFLPLTNLIAAIVGRALLVPKVITSKRALGFHQERVPAFKKLDRVANALSHRITANAPEVAADVERRDGYPIARIAVIPNGLDFGRFADAHEKRLATRSQLDIREGETALIKVANLIPYKGHSELIDAFASLVERGLKVRLFLWEPTEE